MSTTQTEIREGIYNSLQTLFPGSARVTDGLAVDTGDSVFATIKVTIKKPGFDVDAAIGEYQAKQEAAATREAEKAQKEADKAAKAKNKDKVDTSDETTPF